MTLANKYRPKDFTDVTDQDVCTTVLTNQLNKGTFNHAQLFAGNAGCGKTTCARIFANKINGEIIELDCPTHGGVADIKEIVEKARTKPLIKDYKVFILDECHCITKEAWSSLLIVLEENLTSSIFIFCTTDTQKIPNTIISRVTRLNFLPISDNGIRNRITTVCNNENINITANAIEYIIKSAKGNMRQALTNIDKCLLYTDNTIDENIVCKVLGIVPSEVIQRLIEAFHNKDINNIISIINEVYNNGYELHMFITELLDYCLDNNIDIDLINRILTINQDIRYDDSPKNIIIARLIV